MADRVDVSEPFQAPAQQREAAMMGMFVFLGTEIMLFGGIFTAIFVARLLHTEQVVEASKRMHVFIGGINTAVLLTSSLAVALAVHSARARKARRSAALLAGAALLGLAFLGLKAFEYWEEYRDGLLPIFSDPPRFSTPAEHLFMNLYFLGTGLHAVHVTIGIVLLTGVAVRLVLNSLRLPDRTVVVEASGLYWHLVDVIWVFLYPALYLAR
ncbi:cytochrome c oxidase subunit 3 [Mesorhizobium sp. BAC0120]|uniref:cytochrome c oxidase subunit 3 n=1 Tax=Mesorhizobium sp. BAC0120 TaxID=3090670 RepID=UPI00298D0D25|nr:cytochrome c oxidase subunit 3 [Mesorhizobium sp. BAC0120]MDW6023553.1 cytochrome c oxidase subunit 3 [Mesorhizobium sp. BAC0120]